MEGWSGGREGCGSEGWDPSSCDMRERAAVRSEEEGSVSMYGRDSWIEFIRGMTAV